jgi:ankyrin repeat protein
VAATLGDIDTVNMLLARGLPLNAGDYDCRTTLHKSVSEQKSEVVFALLEKGAEHTVKDTWGVTPLVEALQLNQLNVAEALCSKGAKLSSPGVDLVLHAAQNNDAKLTLMCSRAGVDPNIADHDKRTVLHHACSRQNWKAAQNLIKAGVIVNALDRCGTAITLCQMLWTLLSPHLSMLFNVSTPVSDALFCAGLLFCS